MRKIYKYHVKVGDNFINVQGCNFKPVAFQDQNGQLCVWGEADLNNWPEKVCITVIGTGMGVPANSKHIGTCQQGSFVWHAYQLEE